MTVFYARYMPEIWGTDALIVKEINEADFVLAARTAVGQAPAGYKIYQLEQEPTTMGHGKAALPGPGRGLRDVA